MLSHRNFDIQNELDIPTLIDIINIAKIFAFQKIPGDGAHGPHGRSATVIASAIGVGPAMIQSLATEEHSAEGKTMMLMFAWADHAQVIISEYK